jgi:hypothetical protein
MPDLPPDDTQNLGGTQPNDVPEWRPPADARALTPAGGHVQAHARDERRKRKRAERNRSALFLPAWSVALMLLLVFGITGAIIMLVITLGGQSAPGGEPRIVIITAAPSSTPSAPTATATQEIEPLPNTSFQGPIPTFGLEGPTLAPIILSPTPIAISIGATVIVNVDSLNIRADAGTGQTRITTAVDGDRFTVIDGPKQADNYTWWKIRDTADPTREGWAVADYLDVARTE